MGIRYGRVPQGSREVEWHIVSHIDCDGIGGFARLLRARGVEMEKLPETKYPCRGVIAPLWNLWRDSRKEKKRAVQADWLEVGGGTSIHEALYCHLFTVEETLEIVNRCRESGVSVNSFLLKHLDHAIRPGIANPKARTRWLVPVNLRGDIQYDDDTANHVSCVEVSIAPDDSIEMIHADILHRLKRGEHRAKHLFFMVGGILNHEGKIDLLRKERAKLEGNIGSFSNLGIWNVSEASGDGWVFCPPVVSGQLLGAGCVTFQGRLGIAIQGHSSEPSVVAGWIARWLEFIRSAD